MVIPEFLPFKNVSLNDEQINTTFIFLYIFLYIKCLYLVG